MIKLTLPIETPVIKFIVVGRGDGDFQQGKCVPVAEFDRVMTEVWSAVNQWLYNRPEAT
jgi:hypothetical protein